jgi:hypothetical protein
MVKITEDDLYKLLIAEVRYALSRDNHLAPGTCVQHIMDYLPDMSKQWRAHAAEQLANEVISERSFNRLKQDLEWEKLLLFLLDYIEKRPVNADRYMQYLYLKPGYEANIDWNSKELNDKFVENYHNGTV